MCIQDSPCTPSCVPFLGGWWWWWRRWRRGGGCRFRCRRIKDKGHCKSKSKNQGLYLHHLNSRSCLSSPLYCSIRSSVETFCNSRGSIPHAFCPSSMLKRLWQIPNIGCWNLHVTICHLWDLKVPMKVCRFDFHHPVFNKNSDSIKRTVFTIAFSSVTPQAGQQRKPGFDVEKGSRRPISKSNGARLEMLKQTVLRCMLWFWVWIHLLQVT